ncbi:MAG: DUF4376 domain-containing protein [Gammaproteobacteria bacterium]|nr:DUF4376 domain-containing protein [Gammaproteobacteria bacterium]
MSITVDQKIEVLDYLHPEIARVVTEGVLTYPDLTQPPFTELEFEDEYNRMIFEKRIEEKRAEINTRRDLEFDAGLPWLFNGLYQDIMQTRPSDKINLLGIHSEAVQLDKVGVVTEVMKIRALSNNTYTITPQEATTLTRQAGYLTSDIYETSWNLKDQLDNLTYGVNTIADIDAIVWP